MENAHRTVSAGPERRIMKSGRARLAAGHRQNSRVGGYNGCTWYSLNTDGKRLRAAETEACSERSSRSRARRLGGTKGLAKICAADQPMPNNAEQNMTERG